MTEDPVAQGKHQSLAVFLALYSRVNRLQVYLARRQQPLNPKLIISLGLQIPT